MMIWRIHGMSNQRVWLSAEWRNETKWRFGKNSTGVRQVLLYAFSLYFACAKLFYKKEGNQFAAVMVSNAYFCSKCRVQSCKTWASPHYNIVIKQTQGDVTSFGDSGDLCREMLFNCLLPQHILQQLYCCSDQWHGNGIRVATAKHKKLRMTVLHAQGTQYDQRLSLSHQRRITE